MQDIERPGEPVGDRRVFDRKVKLSVDDDMKSWIRIMAAGMGWSEAQFVRHVLSQWRAGECSHIMCEHRDFSDTAVALLSASGSEE
jgi:hypothetical protein